MALAPETLRPATPDELAESITHALLFDGRKRRHTADTYMAHITAEHLIEHLRLSGFVIMKKPYQQPPAGTIAS